MTEEGREGDFSELFTVEPKVSRVRPSFPIMREGMVTIHGAVYARADFSVIPEAFQMVLENEILFKNKLYVLYKILVTSFL